MSGGPGSGPSGSVGQRTDGYRGGIQAGTTASSGASLRLEHKVREAVASLTDHHGLTWSKGLSGNAIAALLGVSTRVEGIDLPGVRPDVGLWLAQASGRPVVAVEAKKQGPVGNAIERWFKNWAVLSALGVRIYLTFSPVPGSSTATPPSGLLSSRSP